MARLTEFDLDDERFRISDELRHAPLDASLAQIGQLNPVIAAGDADRLVLVCGFRRISALKRQERGSALCRILRGWTGAALLDLALWDNVAHRELTALEQARALFALKHRFGVAREELIARYLPALGLAARADVLRSYLELHAAVPELQALFRRGSIPPGSMQKLANWSPEDQRAAAAVLSEARFSASLLRQTLDLVEDLSGSERTPRAAVLAHSELLQACRDGSATPFQRGETIHRMLYRKRNPRLARAEERFAAKRKELGLTGAIRVSPDAFFEQPRIRVEFEAASPKQFRETAAALQESARRPGLESLFDPE